MVAFLFQKLPLTLKVVAALLFLLLLYARHFAGEH
jgi:hypothetical protein